MREQFRQALINIVFVRSPEGKEKLRPALSSGNLEKTLTAPVTAIVAWDSELYERLPELFPHGGYTPCIELLRKAVSSASAGLAVNQLLASPCGNSSGRRS